MDFETRKVSENFEMGHFDTDLQVLTLTTRRDYW